MDAIGGGEYTDEEEGEEARVRQNVGDSLLSLVSRRWGVGCGGAGMRGWG